MAGILSNSNNNKKKKKSTIFIERLFPVVQKHFTYSYKNNNKELSLKIDATISLHVLPRKSSGFLHNK